MHSQNGKVTLTVVAFACVFLAVWAGLIFVLPLFLHGSTYGWTDLDWVAHGLTNTLSDLEETARLVETYTRQHSEDTGTPAEFPLEHYETGLGFVLPSEIVALSRQSVYDPRMLLDWRYAGNNENKFDTRPFMYVAGRDWFVLVAAGPDGVYEGNLIKSLVADKDQITTATLRERLQPFSYDPTNGFRSSGDVFFGARAVFGGDLFALRREIKDAQAKAKAEGTPSTNGGKGGPFFPKSPSRTPNQKSGDRKVRMWDE